MKKVARGYRLVFGYLGLFLMFIGGVTLFPLIIAAFYPEEIACYPSFLIPGLVYLAVGAILFFVLIYKREKARFGKYEDSLLLLLIWVAAVLAGALPFHLASIAGNFSEPMNFSECFFEAVSGYTTTGYTVFPTGDFVGEPGAYCPHVFTFHRAWMHFVGGAGLVLIVTSVLSDRYNLKLYFAEGHNDKLVPNLARSAKLIFAIYTGYTIVGTFGLWFSGMDAFDALCHSIGALATGGFSTRAAGVYYYQTAAFTGNGIFPGNTIAIEVVLELIMLMGATNFLLHTFLLRGKVREFVKDIEIRVGFFVLLFLIVVTTLSTMYLFAPTASNLYGGWNAPQTGTDFWTSLRYNAFYIISCGTTTGYVNFQSVRQLGEVAIFTGILAMSIGGGTGSTAGGIKQYRVGVLMKDFIASIRYRFSSSRALNPKPIYRFGVEREIEKSGTDDAHNFFLLYLLTILVGTLVLLLLPDIGFQDSIYSVAAALSAAGIAPFDFAEYQATHPVAYYNIFLWDMSLEMLVGRLEILPLFYAFHRVFISPFERKRRIATLED